MVWAKKKKQQGNKQQQQQQQFAMTSASSTSASATATLKKGLYSNNVELFKKLHSTAYYSRFLEVKIRPDGRALNEVRRTRIVRNCLTGDLVNGSSLCSIGNTRVICGVRCEAMKPISSVVPGRGKISLQVHLTGFCHGEVKKGKEKKKK